jgi:transcriptional regulator with XRE-family HTH domain
MGTMTKERLTLSERLRRLRARRGLTVEQAAEAVGVKPRTWQSWEQPSQDRRPSASHLILIDLLERGKL